MTESVAEPVKAGKGEEEAEECPDFMEDGFLDNLAVVDSCYSDGDENANDVPTSEESVPSVGVGDVVKVTEPPGTTEEAKKLAVAPVAARSKLGTSTALKHEFIPRPVRAKITIKPKPAAIVIEEGSNKEDNAASSQRRTSSDKITAAKKAALEINGDHNLQGRSFPTLFDKVIEFEPRKEPVRRERDLRERLRSKEHEGHHVSRERAVRRTSKERVESHHKPRSRERDHRPKSRERDHGLPERPVPRDRKPRSRERDRLPRTGERERLPKSREKELVDSRRSRATDHIHPNRKWVKEHIKDVSTTKKADKRVEKVREKSKIMDSEDNLLPPGTEDVLLPDAAALIAKKEAAEKAKKEAVEMARKADKASKTAKRRRASGGDGSEGRKKLRGASDETYQEKIERDLDRMSRELSLERLKDLDRDLRREKMRTSDRELERQRLVNEKLNEEIRQMRELRDRKRHERSISRDRSIERERRRVEESRRRLRGRRYGDLSPVSVGRNSELSFEMSPGPMRYDNRYESSRRPADRSYSPISSGGDSAEIGSSERSRRRKRSPFWLEMERKLGISVMGGASYEYATAKVPPAHYQSPAPVPAVMALPHPPPATYFSPVPAMFTVPPPAAVTIPPPMSVPVPVAVPPQVAVPALLAVPAPVPVSAPPAAEDESQLSEIEAIEAKQAPITFVFRGPVQASVPEAPPPPQISGENMSLSSFLEASVKAMPAQLTGLAARCQDALDAMRDDETLDRFTTGRFVVATAADDLQRYSCKTRFDHPAQETLMKLKSPLLRTTDVRLESTARPAKLAEPQPLPITSELEDVDSGDDIDVSADEIDSCDDIAIIAEVPKNKVIDMLDLDPVGDSSDGDVPCSECARRSRVKQRSVGVNTAVAATTRDAGTQVTWSDDGEVELDDVSDESDGVGDRTRAMRTQYERFRQSIESAGKERKLDAGNERGEAVLGQQKSGGRGPTSNQKTGGPTTNQKKDSVARPISNQQKSGAPSLISNQQKSGDSSLISNLQKSGGSSLISNQQKSGGSSLILNQQKSGAPSLISNQQKSGGPSLISNQQKSGAPSLISNQQKSGGPSLISNQQKSGGPLMFSKQESSGPLISNQQGSGGPISMQLNTKGLASGLMASRQDSDWRRPSLPAQPDVDQPLFSRREALYMPFPSQSSFLERPGTLNAGPMAAQTMPGGLTGTKHAPEASGTKFRRDSGGSAGLQPLGGNSSFPRGLPDAPFEQSRPHLGAVWAQMFQGGQPFQGSRQFQGGQSFQGSQPFRGISPLLGDSVNGSVSSGNGGLRNNSLLGMGPQGTMNPLGNSGPMGNSGALGNHVNQFGRNLLFATSSSPFLHDGEFVSRAKLLGQSQGGAFAGAQNPGFHTDTGGRYN